MLKKIQSLNALRTFEVCARVESVQDAAKILHVTPSAVSHQLRKLEEELGFELFIRSHRKITPTSKGYELQSTVSKGLELISDKIDALSDNRHTELVINVLPIFSIRWLNPRLISFFKAHPEIDLTIKNSYRVEDLSHQKCDLAIRWGKGDWSDVESIKLFDEYALPVLNPDLLESSTVNEEKDLLNLPLIQTFDGAKHWEHWANLKGYDIKNKLKYIKFNDPAAALQAASDGLGVILGPLSLIQSELENGNLISPFRNTKNASVPTGNAYYLVTSTNTSNANLEKFIRWILEETEIFKKELVELYKI